MHKAVGYLVKWLSVLVIFVGFMLAFGGFLGCVGYSRNCNAYLPRDQLTSCIAEKEEVTEQSAAFFIVGALVMGLGGVGVSAGKKRVQSSARTDPEQEFELV